MLTQKIVLLILVTVLTTAGLAVLAQSAKKPAMTSTAIEWNSLETKPNANGSGKNGPVTIGQDGGAPYGTFTYPNSGNTYSNA